MTAPHTDSELAGMLRNPLREMLLVGPIRLAAADRLVFYAALAAKLPKVPCPTCRGNRRVPGQTPHGNPIWVTCPNPRCEGGSEQLTLADAVAQSVVLNDPTLKCCTKAEEALVATLRSVRAES